jgi:hypothetical protein
MKDIRGIAGDVSLWGMGGHAAASLTGNKSGVPAPFKVIGPVGECGIGRHTVGQDLEAPIPFAPVDRSHGILGILLIGKDIAQDACGIYFIRGRDGDIGSEEAHIAGIGYGGCERGIFNGVV